MKTPILQYRDNFKCANGRLGRTKLMEYKINIEYARLILQVARQLPQFNREQAKKIVCQMEEEGVIEPFMN